MSEMTPEPHAEDDPPYFHEPDEDSNPPRPPDHLEPEEDED